MTDKKISQLVAVTSVDDADEFVLARSGTSNKITGANLKSAFTATAEVTANQGNGYATEHIFDLGSSGPHSVQITLTGLVLTGDGETFGNDSGTIYVGPNSSALDQSHFTRTETSADGVFYAAATLVEIGPQSAADPTSPTFEIQSTSVPTNALLLSSRYLKVPIVIAENNTADIYAGANQPSAQIRIDLTYT